MPGLGAIESVAESVESTTIGRMATKELVEKIGELKIGEIDLTRFQGVDTFQTSQRCLDEINKGLAGLGTRVKQSVSGQLEEWQSSEPAEFLKDEYPVVLGKTADDREFVHAVLPNLTLVKDSSGSVVRLENGADKLAAPANGIDSSIPSSVSITTSGDISNWIRTTHGQFTLSGNAFAPVSQATTQTGAQFELEKVLGSSGRLQPGTYDMGWDEFQNTFATTKARQRILHGMLAGLNKLQEGGVNHVDVFGSFVSKKGLANESLGRYSVVAPGDFDLIYPSKGADMDRLQFSVGTWNKGAFGGDIFHDEQYLWDIDRDANDLKTFDGRTGEEVGFVRLHFGNDLPQALNFQKVPIRLKR